MSCLMLHWLERLHHDGVLKPGSSLIEFGPQDLDIPKPIVEASARRMMPSESVAERVNAIFDGWGGPHRTCQADFYSLFGVTSYVSIDPFDARAHYSYDLNYYFLHFSHYDIVTSFGTAEHVFDISQCFRAAHRLLRPGGVLLNVMPAYGDIDHGFYNLHPILYRGLAAHSGFEMCDFRYVDDVGFRSEMAKAGGTDIFDFGTLPIRLEDCADEKNFKRKVHRQYLANAKLHENPALPGGARDSTVFDYCYVALRKRRSGRFRSPYQYLQDSSLLAASHPGFIGNFVELFARWFRS